ncbi:hypothetical protein C8R45DRAFT_947079 [Mycena sanguinolenta]|nr:hypothetical protein C8R45DRAFT_947079 [Mycena sanguinolenta]
MFQTRLHPHVVTESGIPDGEALGMVWFSHFSATCFRTYELRGGLTVLAPCGGPSVIAQGMRDTKVGKHGGWLRHHDVPGRIGCIIREHAMEPPVATRWLLRHAVLVAPQMMRTTPKMSHRTFPGQPPDDVALPNEGGATRYRMPREPPGGYWWLHRMFSIDDMDSESSIAIVIDLRQ